MSHARPGNTILFAGGGTGGHLFPGIALAEEFLKRDPATRVVFAGTSRGLEARVIPEMGWPLARLEVYGLVGIHGWRRIKSLASLPRALVQALIILVRYRPSLVVGLGGYASAPLLLAAMIGGIPFVIQEQNAFPGVVNRLLAPFADAVFIAFAEAGRHLRSRRIHDLGNPLRRLAGPEVGTSEKEREGSGVNLLVIGGSQGARALNRVVPGAFLKLCQTRPDLTIVHQTGNTDYEAVREAYGPAGERAEVVDFISDIGSYYARADLVVARAGALTLAEIAALGKPSILVPFPHAAHDHQTFNARAFARAGAAELIPEAELDDISLARKLETIITTDQRLRQMAAAARSLARLGAREKIVDCCLELVERKSGK